MSYSFMYRRLYIIKLDTCKVVSQLNVMAPHAVEWKTSRIDSIVEYLIIIGPIRVRMMF